MCDVTIIITKNCFIYLEFFRCEINTNHSWCCLHCLSNTVCPTRYRTRHFFNNSNTNEDIATKFVNV